MGAETWVPIIDQLIWQVYYRILSFISYHGPIDEAYEATKILTGKRGGEVYWVVPDRVFRWDSVTVSPGIKINIWFMGSALRRKNTCMARVGWWTLWILSETLKARAEILE